MDPITPTAALASWQAATDLLHRASETLEAASRHRAEAAAAFQAADANEREAFRLYEAAVNHVAAATVAAEDAGILPAPVWPW